MVGGETIDEVGVRADRFIARVLDEVPDGDAVAFSHGHLLAILIAAGGRLETGRGPPSSARHGDRRPARLAPRGSSDPRPQPPRRRHPRPAVPDVGGGGGGVGDHVHRGRSDGRRRAVGCPTCRQRSSVPPPAPDDRREARDVVVVGRFWSSGSVAYSIEAEGERMVWR